MIMSCSCTEAVRRHGITAVESLLEEKLKKCVPPKGRIALFQFFPKKH